MIDAFSVTVVRRTPRSEASHPRLWCVCHNILGGTRTYPADAKTSTQIGQMAP